SCDMLFAHYTRTATHSTYSLSLHDALPICGRFDLHELVRQFAAEMLAEDAVEQERRRGAHADYFTSYLAGKRAALDAIPDPEALDRKSTRLNSSHVKISYAVFCLKKKTSKI